MSATLASIVPLTRPAIGATPTYTLPSRCGWMPMWSTGRAGNSGAGPSISVRCRYSVSRTSRNRSTPQSATRNFSRARLRSRR